MPLAILGQNVELGGQYVLMFITSYKNNSALGSIQNVVTI